MGIHIELGSDVCISGLTRTQQDRLHEEYDFTYSAKEMRCGKLQYVTKWMPVVKHLNHDSVALPYGCWPDVYRFFQGASVGWATTWSGTVGNSGSLGGIFKGDDRDSQADVLEAVFAAHQRHQYATCIIAPCGAGKTWTAMRIIDRLAQPTIVLCHTKELLNQWLGWFKSTFPHVTHGTCVNGKYTPGFLTVGLIQSVRKYMGEISGAYSVLIQDECHKIPCVTFTDVVDRISATIKIGLTASETRADGLHPMMTRMLGPIVARITQSEMYAEGTVLPFDVQWVETNWGWDVGDPAKYYQRMMTDLVEDFGRNEVIVRTVAEAVERDRRQALVLTRRVAHVEELATMLDAFLPGQVQYLHGECSAKHRAGVMDNLTSGFMPVTVAQTELAKEGLDAPYLDCLVWAHPVRDKNTVQQAVGRVQRTAAGKARRPLVLDFVDAVPLLYHQAQARARVYRKLKEGATDAFDNGRA